jgi:hypothetical protein
MGYYKDIRIRQRIDDYLRINAAIQANLGTKSKFDIGSRRDAKTIWIQLLREISLLDKEYYRTLASPKEQELVSALDIGS